MTEVHIRKAPGVGGRRLLCYYREEMSISTRPVNTAEHTFYGCDIWIEETAAATFPTLFCSNRENTKRGNDVDPDIPEKSGRTPFLPSPHSGCEGIVKMLLERNGVNSGMADESGQKPSSRAAGGV
ncbi:hypothetical protein HOY80DRAFT_1032184 [Tuber brumale]|nr:hypothetical protein HOY80DRAFT_1032184 [Tuber brumale]